MNNMNTIESTYDDIARQANLSSGLIIHGFHKSEHCKGEVCPVHKPSNHQYRDCILNFNFEVFIFERKVENADGTYTWVPDPDDWKMQHSGGSILYRNSIKCLQCGDNIVSRTRHDFVTCSCGLVFVDGGSDYKRIGGNPKDWVDTSIIYDNGEWITHTA